MFYVCALSTRHSTLLSPPTTAVTTLCYTPPPFLKLTWFKRITLDGRMQQTINSGARCRQLGHLLFTTSLSSFPPFFEWFNTASGYVQSFFTLVSSRSNHFISNRLASQTLRSLRQGAQLFMTSSMPWTVRPIKQNGVWEEWKDGKKLEEQIAEVKVNRRRSNDKIKVRQT